MERSTKNLNPLSDSGIISLGETSLPVIQPHVLVLGVHSVFSSMLCTHIKQHSFYFSDFRNGEMEISETIIKSILVRAVFVSYELNNCKGPAFVRAIKQFDPGIEVIGVSIEHSDLKVLRMLGAGVRAFVTYNSPVEEIIHALNSVLNHQYYFNDCLSESIFKYWLSTLDHTDSPYKVILTEIEIEIIGYLYEGYTHEEIRVKMIKSKKRIDNIICEMMLSTGSKNSHDLVRYAIEQELICPLQGAKEIIPKMDF